MGVITIFLLTLIIALVIGNLLLSFTRGTGGQEPGPDALPIDVPDVEPLKPVVPGAAKIPDSHLVAVNEKVLMAHNRLGKLEKLLLSNGNSHLTHNLGAKMRALDHFRANTQVEIKALQEMVEELGSKKKKTKKKGKKERELTPREMHDIIYKSG